MRVLVQKCLSAYVSIDNRIYNNIKDENGVMNKSLLDVQGEILSISQFTLYGDASNGNRPSYVKAMKREKATILYDEFNKKLNNLVPTKTGVFGADMKIALINDGPTTLLLER